MAISITQPVISMFLWNGFWTPESFTTHPCSNCFILTKWRWSWFRGNCLKNCGFPVEVAPWFNFLQHRFNCMAIERKALSNERRFNWSFKPKTILIKSKYGLCDSLPVKYRGLPTSSKNFKGRSGTVSASQIKIRSWLQLRANSIFKNCWYSQLLLERWSLVWFWSKWRSIFSDRMMVKQSLRW